MMSRRGANAVAGSAAAGVAAVPWARYVRPATFKSYTHACEAPPAFWGGGAIPLVKGTVRGADGSTAVASVKTYEHPREVRSPSRELGLADVNSMYCLGNEDLVRYFPEGVGGKVAQLFVPGHPRGLLYRQQSHLLNTIIGKLPFIKTKGEAVRALCDGRPGLILDGESGSGKSALLCQSVHYARALGVLTLYVPNCRDWTHGEWAWPAMLLPGFWDAPDAGRQFLHYFARANREALAQMPLAVTPANLPLAASGESHPTNIAELCDWGVRGGAPSNLDRQSVAVKYVMDELMAEKSRPILFAIDGLNLFAGDTHFRYPHPDFYKSMSSWSDTDVDLHPQELPRIPAARLTFVRALNRMMLAPDPNKLFVTCTTRDFAPFDGGVSGFREEVSDRHRNSLDEYRPFCPARDTVLHPMRVGNLNEYEHRAFLRFLVNSGELAGLGWGPLWHYTPAFERKLYKIDFLSGRNPQRVVDHYHGELVWTKEFGRLREKQHLVHARATESRERSNALHARIQQQQQVSVGEAGAISGGAGVYQRNPRKPDPFAVPEAAAGPTA